MVPKRDSGTGDFSEFSTEGRLEDQKQSLQHMFCFVVVDFQVLTKLLFVEQRTFS